MSDTLIISTNDRQLVITVSENQSTVLTFDPILSSYADILVIVKKSAQLIVTQSLNDSFLSDTQHLTIQAEQDAYVKMHIQARPVHTLHIKLQIVGEHAHIDCMVTHKSKDQDRIVISSVQEHCVPNGSTTMKVRGTLDQASILTFHGVIKVHPQAEQSNAILDHKALLLHANARCTAVPSLEVLNNRVRCKHGSAIGRLPVDQLQYLMHHGLDDMQARNLLIDGFFND